MYLWWLKSSVTGSKTSCKNEARLIWWDSVQRQLRQTERPGQPFRQIQGPHTYKLRFFLVIQQKSVVPVGPHWSWRRLAVTPLPQKDPQTCEWSPPWGQTGSAAPAWKLCSSCPVDTSSESNFTPFTLHHIVAVLLLTEHPHSLFSSFLYVLAF